MLRFFLLHVLFGIVLSEIVKDGNSTADEFLEFNNRKTRVLSRRKRFLIFPEGSSLQLAFCIQTAALIPIGDIFLYASTAALAWNLPSDTMLLDYLKQNERPLRRGDNLQIGYVNENGRVIAKVPYKRKTIVNPAFAKRSVDDGEVTFKEKLKLKIDRLKMHQKHSQKDNNRNEMDEKSIEYHRSNRFELFGKIEKLLTALKRDGRQCVLNKLCESAQRSDQGTFMDEFIKAVFTLPKSSHLKEELQEYDLAHTSGVDCTSKYPGCEDFIPTPL